VSEATDAIERFVVRVDEAVLDDLRRRLANTRFPDRIEGTGWEYGVSVDDLRELVSYWRDGYDWRAQEARLNRLAHFRTCIDGQSIHFVHARSAHADALPLLLLHGWPGSIVEFLDVIRVSPIRKRTAARHATRSTSSRRRCRATASRSRRARAAGTCGASRARSSS